MSCEVCLDKFGCPSNAIPDFELKRHDTRPPFILSVADCNGPLDLDDSVVEVSMWAKAKLKKNITASDTSIELADAIGFEQALVGDVIVVSRIRSPEQMLVSGFDETDKKINVSRAYHGTSASAFKKGTEIKIFRVLNSIADIEKITETINNLDGTTSSLHTETRLVYNWNPEDTCLPGCYWLEFKVLKMNVTAISQLSGISSISVSMCSMGTAVESVRRFPSDSEGYLIRINNSYVNELVYI